MNKFQSGIATIRTTPAVNYAVLLSRAIIVSVALLIVGCSTGPDEEGGVIGTGIRLKGTASSPVMLADSAIEVKARDGQKSLLPLRAGNRFLVDSAIGDGPWILKATLSNDITLYGLSFGEGNSNINSYTDVVLRNWFALKSTDLDDAFDSSQPFASLPTLAEFDVIAAQLFSVVDLVFESYEIQAQLVLTGDYPANDLGVDGFLDDNPILINNGIVKVLLTDPVSGTQSQTSSDLELNQSFGRGDNTAPSAPTGVRAVGSLLDEMIIIWEPALDDTAVQGYEVWRDGSLIAKTPYPVYSDAGLESGRQYTYRISAFDVAGNMSDRSAEVVGVTLGLIGTQAPLMPSRLSLLGNANNRIELIWAQDVVADVVAFNLYRGASSGAMGLLVKTTSSIAVDTAVVDGQSYCYQVSALGASGIESPRSDELCLIAGRAPTDQTGGSDSDILLNLPDIDSLVCDQSLQQSDVQQNHTLTAGCYVVSDSIVVAPFTKLTLSAGVVVKFAAGVKLVIEQNAALTTNGTATSPVVLTGLLSAPGYWGGIEFNRTSNPANLLRNTLVQFAGGGDLRAAIMIRASDTEKTRLRVENSVVRFNSNLGIMGQSNGILLESFENNRFTQNREPASFNLDLIDAISGSSDFSGNDVDWIDVPRNVHSKPVVIANPGVTIRSNGMKIVNAPLTFEAGLDIVVLPDAVIDVSGPLSIQGTADEPVSLVGLDASAGSWKGLLLSGAGAKVINHARIRNAGFGSPITGAIQLACTTTEPVTLTVDNTDIVDSEGWGIYQNSASCNVELGENVGFTGIALGSVNTPQ